MTIVLLLFFIIALFLEGLLTTLPLTLLALIILLLQKREDWIFLLAFCSGILLDFFTLRPLGQSSIFFVLFLSLMLLYEKKYEIQTVPFVMVTSFFGSLAYLMYVHVPSVLLQAFVSMLGASIIFIGYKAYRKRYIIRNPY